MSTSHTLESWLRNSRAQSTSLADENGNEISHADWEDFFKKYLPHVVGGEDQYLVSTIPTKDVTGLGFDDAAAVYLGPDWQPVIRAAVHRRLFKPVGGDTSHLRNDIPDDFEPEDSFRLMRIDIRQVDDEGIASLFFENKANLSIKRVAAWSWFRG